MHYNPRWRFHTQYRLFRKVVCCYVFKLFFISVLVVSNSFVLAESELIGFIEIQVDGRVIKLQVKRTCLSGTSQQTVYLYRGTSCSNEEFEQVREWFERHNLSLGFTRDEEQLDETSEVSEVSEIYKRFMLRLAPANSFESEGLLRSRGLYDPSDSLYQDQNAAVLSPHQSTLERGNLTDWSRLFGRTRVNVPVFISHPISHLMMPSVADGDSISCLNSDEEHSAARAIDSVGASLCITEQRATSTITQYGETITITFTPFRESCIENTCTDMVDDQDVEDY